MYYICIVANNPVTISPKFPNTEVRSFGKLNVSVENEY